LPFYFLETENPALLGCLNTFVDSCDQFIVFLDFLKPGPQLSALRLCAQLALFPYLPAYETGQKGARRT
jgi:hypothetical protein